MQLRLEPDQTRRRRHRLHQGQNRSAPASTVSSLACDGNHIDPDPAARERQNQYAVTCIELCGKLGIPAIGGQSGTMRGRPLAGTGGRDRPVYTEKYFPSCEKNNVRILWEPYAGGPNIATGPVGWEALFKAFKDSPHVGLQFDPSHLVWQFMDPVQAARDFADKIYDVHLKDTEILWHLVRRGGIKPVNDATLVALPRARPRLGRLEGLLRRARRKRLHRRDEHRERRRVLLPGVRPRENFTEQFKRGFRVAHEYLKTLVPPVTA